MHINRTTPLLSFIVVGALSLAACGGSDSGSGDADPCDAAQKVADTFEEGESAASAEDAIAALGNFADALSDFAEVAPDDLKDDVELLADATQKLSESDPETGPSEELLALVDGEEYDAAGERLEDYIQGTCGIDF